MIRLFQCKLTVRAAHVVDLLEFIMSSIFFFCEIQSPTVGQNKGAAYHKLKRVRVTAQLAVRARTKLKLQVRIHLICC